MKSVFTAISFFLSLFFMVENCFAVSLRATANKLGQEAIRIGASLGVLALAIGGIYMAMGKQEGGSKVNQAILGIIIILLAPAIVSLIKSLI